MLIVGYGALPVTIKTSVILHPNTQSRLIAEKGFRIGETVHPYYRTLIYSNLVEDKLKQNAYGEDTMSGTIYTLTKWVTRIPDNVTDRPAEERMACVVPALFCATSFLSDARYRTGN